MLAAGADPAAFLARHPDGVQELRPDDAHQWLTSSDPAEIVQAQAALPYVWTTVAASAVFVLVSIAAAMAATVRRQRHDLAVLKALGASRAEIRQLVLVQGGLIALAALALGAPLGLAAGRWAWSRFATDLGVVATSELLPLPLLLTLGGTFAAALAGTLLPAVVVARVAPASSLREA